MAEGVDVREPRQVGQRQFLFSEKRARHQGQGRVLRSADRDLAFEALTALDPDAVHGRALAASPLPAREGSGWVRAKRGLGYSTHVSVPSLLGRGSAQA